MYIPVIIAMALGVAAIILVLIFNAFMRKTITLLAEWIEDTQNKVDGIKAVQDADLEAMKRHIRSPQSPKAPEPFIPRGIEQLIKTLTTIPIEVPTQEEEEEALLGEQIVSRMRKHEKAVAERLSKLYSTAAEPESQEQDIRQPLFIRIDDNEDVSPIVDILRFLGRM